MQYEVSSNQNSLIVCISELFSCFAFFGILSLMMLFFLHDVQLPPKLSYQLLGNFISVSLIGTLCGGIIGNRYLSCRLACLLGLISYTIGYFSLICFDKLLFLYIGLAFLALGFGLFEPNIRILFGNNYKNFSKSERDTRFIILHIFNIGGQLLGPILFTYLMVINPHYMFFSAGIFALIGVFFFTFNYTSLNCIESRFTHDNNRKHFYLGVCIVILLIILSFYVILQHDVRHLFELLLIPIIVFFSLKLPKLNRDLRIKMYSLAFILIGLFIAEICLRQSFGLIDLFTQTYVNQIVFGVHIHTGLFESVEPLFILIMFPLVIKIRKGIVNTGYHISAGSSLSFGLFMLSICFACLVVGAIFANGERISVAWLLLCYFFMAIGELCIVPIATSSVFSWSPDNWKGGMMGIFFLVIGLSSYFNDRVGKYISSDSGNPKLLTYTHLFFSLTIIALVFSIVLGIVWKRWEQKQKQVLNLEE